MASRSLCIGIVCFAVLLGYQAFVTSPTEAAIARDTVSRGECGSCTSVNWSHTVGSGSNKLLEVTVTWYAYGTARTVSSVTYGGVALTYRGRAVNSNCGLECAVEKWTLTNPSSGSASVVATMTGSVRGLEGGGVSWTGVDQTTPVGTFAGATGVGTTASVAVTSASGEVVSDGLSWYSTSGLPTIGSGQTLHWIDLDPETWHYSGANYENGATSTSMAWTSGNSAQWAIGGLPLKPSGSGGGSGNETLLWNDNSNNETLFRIQWKHTAQPSYADLTTVSADTQSYVVTYTTETSRCYRVRAENSAGASAWSNELCH